MAPAARAYHGPVPLTGEYEPSRQQWVRDQVQAYEDSGGQRANTLRDTGIPIALFTTRGRKSGKLRKSPLMRVEHEGAYAMVASDGGAPRHPAWYRNLTADPTALTVQDGPGRSMRWLGSSPATSVGFGGTERWRSIPSTPATRSAPTG